MVWWTWLLTNVLTRWNDPNFRYLLREMERGGGSIFMITVIATWAYSPQTPDEKPRFKEIGGYTAFDYAYKEEYSLYEYGVVATWHG